MNKLWKCVAFASALVLLTGTGYVFAANRPPANVSKPTESFSPAPGTARFVTYNIVHGTRVPIPPSLVRNTIVDANLDAVGDLLRNQRPVVVALQEAGTNSYPRTSRVARQGAFPSWTDAGVVPNSPRHGVALLSSKTLEEVSSHALVQGVTPDKGWIAATVRVEELGGPVRVVSVHLDPFSASARERQVDQLIEAFEDEGLPLVVLGDFNCGWEHGRCVERLASGLVMSAAPTDSPTYRFLGVRDNLDWILVSRQLRITAVRVLDDSYSDHRPVVADVALNETP